MLKQWASFRFNPQSLFLAGEQGAWYDPSDFSSMYQDSAGTTPVTAVTQSVGLLLDKRLGLVRGAEQRAGFVPALQGVATVATYNTATGAGSATRVDATNRSLLDMAGLPAGSYVVSVACATGVISLRGNGGALVLQAVNAGATFDGIVHLATAGLSIYPDVNGVTSTFTVNSVKALPGNHATQATAGSRPTLQVDGNGKYLLRPNGTSSFMVTGNIDASAFDKCTIWTAVRKTSDAASAVTFETSTNSGLVAGTVAIFAPASAASNYGFRTTGASVANLRTATTFTAPITNVLSVAFDNAGASVALQNMPRVNGVTPTLDTVLPTMPGAFGNQPLYLFARAGTSLFSSADFYGGIVRFSAAASTAAQISSGEQYEAQKSGVTLA